MVGGFYLAFTFAHWVGKSVWTVLWTTMVIHGMRNAVSVLLYVAKEML